MKLIIFSLKKKLHIHNFHESTCQQRQSHTLVLGLVMFYFFEAVESWDIALDNRVLVSLEIVYNFAHALSL